MAEEKEAEGAEEKKTTMVVMMPKEELGLRSAVTVTADTLMYAFPLLNGELFPGTLNVRIIFRAGEKIPNKRLEVLLFTQFANNSKNVSITHDFYQREAVAIFVRDASWAMAPELNLYSNGAKIVGLLQKIIVYKWPALGYGCGVEFLEQ